MAALRQELPFYGAGFECSIELAGRPDIDAALDQVDLVELIPESYFFGRLPAFLRKLAQRQTPVVGHSVDLSLGTDEPIKQKHIDRVRLILESLNCVVYSDHLCMTGADGIEIGQLTTLPFTQAVADVVVRKVERLQRQFSVPFMIENITNRFLVPGAELSETEFINNIVRRTGCGLLLDITNTYINSVNHGFNPYEWMDALDLKAVMGIHLAGGIRERGFFYDTHSQAVHLEVWELFRYVAARASPKVVIVEWDQDTPALSRILAEVRQAEAILTGCASRVLRGETPGLGLEARL